MATKKLTRLHWKLYFPLVLSLWLIIGITITYFVMHEKQRQRDNLENRLINVNNTVIDAYERGVNLQNTVDFIRLFTDNTTLAPLRITVYDNSGKMLADNPAATIQLYDEQGNPNENLIQLMNDDDKSTVKDMDYDGNVNMINSKGSKDGLIYSFAALPYQGEVLSFLRIDPMIWFVVVLLGIITSVFSYIGVRAVCKNVYSLNNFAKAIAEGNVPENIDSWQFSNDELGEVSHNLLTVYRNKLHAEQEKIHHERQICMNVSHELKTPVGIIKGYIDTVLTDPSMPNDVKERFLLRAQQNTDRLANLVSDVSMVMRLEDNGGSLKGSPIDFTALVKRIAEDCSQGNITGDLKFIYNLPAKCRVIGHESLLTNALLNLIYNATKHSGGSEISLDWQGLKNGMHVFTFADNGFGVEDKHLSRLFDLFYRVDNGRTRKAGGSGLGLPLVKKIITVMGGTITVANAPEGGLKFTFTLPAAQ